MRAIQNQNVTTPYQRFAYHGNERWLQRLSQDVRNAWLGMRPRSVRKNDTPLACLPVGRDAPGRGVASMTLSKNEVLEEQNEVEEL